MSPLQMLAILALVVYAIYKQTKVHEITAQNRFKLAIIYGIVGIVIGGFDLPSGPVGIGFVVGSLALSVVVGLLRGRLTRLWVDQGNRVFTQGTAVTIGLFIAMVVIKFGLGTASYFLHVDDGEGFGEVMVMIALMIGVQAELVWRRGQHMIATKTVNRNVRPVAVTAH